MPSGIIKGLSVLAKSLIFKAGDAGFEPTTFGSGDHFEGFPQLPDFIQLSCLFTFSPVHVLFLLLLLCSLFLKCGHKSVTGSRA